MSFADSLPALQRAALRAHATTPNYKRRVATAHQIIADGLSASPDAYVAHSFGKDSAVMAHLVMEANPGVSLRFLSWDETRILDNYDEVIAQWQARWIINLTEVNLSRQTIDEKRADRWLALEQVAPTSGYFVGLRKEESKTRRMNLSVMGNIAHLKNGMWRITPIADWNEQDVGAYIVAHDLPMLDSYHKHGLSHRTTARVPRHIVRGQALTALRTRDPHGFERLAMIFPEVREWV